MLEIASRASGSAVRRLRRAARGRRCDALRPLPDSPAGVRVAPLRRAVPRIGSFHFARVQVPGRRLSRNAGRRDLRRTVWSRRRFNGRIRRGRRGPRDGARDAPPRLSPRGSASARGLAATRIALRFAPPPKNPGDRAAERTCSRPAARERPRRVSRARRDEGTGAARRRRRDVGVDRAGVRRRSGKSRGPARECLVLRARLPGRFRP